MHSTKFGSLEGYLLELALQSSELGVGTVIQYESTPRSDRYLAQLEHAGVRTVIVDSGGPYARASWRAARLIGEIRPRVVHTHFTPPRLLPVICSAARLFATDRVVATAHNLQPPGRSVKLRLQYAGVDAVLGVSQAVTRSLLDGGLNPSVAETHYLGLPKPLVLREEERAELRSKFRVSADTILFGVIAFDAPFKGIDVLLRALAVAVESGLDLQLLQVGVEPSASQLPQLATELGIQDRVHWAGIHDEGWRLLQAADIYVQPSRAGEGLPLALMEALALGLPCVATDVSGNTEAVSDGVEGFVARPDEPADLAAAMLRMVAERDRWGQFSSRAREKFRGMFDGKRSAKDTILRYYRLAG